MFASYIDKLFQFKLDEALAHGSRFIHTFCYYIFSDPYMENCAVVV